MMNDFFDSDPVKGHVHEVSLAMFPSLEAAGRARGCRVSRIDLATCRGKTCLLEQVAGALSFPSWFGGNWDALADCLQDLEWLPATGGWVLLVGHAGGMRSAAPRDFGVFLEVLEEAGGFWSTRERTFRVFLAVD